MAHTLGISRSTALVARMAAIALACVTVLFSAASRSDAAIYGSIEQVIPIAAGTWSQTSTTYAPTTDSSGGFYWDADKYDGDVTVYFEAHIRSQDSSTVGNVTVGLFASGETSTPVATVTNTNGDTNYHLERSDAATLTDDTFYTMRMKATTGTVAVREARVIVVQSATAPTGITKTETQIEVGHIFSTTSSSYTGDTVPRYWYLQDVSSKYDASPVCYFEAVMRSSSSSNTATVSLIGAGGTSSPLASVTTTSTSVTRQRSSSFDCNTTQTVHPEIKSSSDGTSVSLYSARVIIDQNGSDLTKYESVVMLQSYNMSSYSSTSWIAATAFTYEPSNYAASIGSTSVTSPFDYVNAKVTDGSYYASTMVCSSNCSSSSSPVDTGGSQIDDITATDYTIYRSGEVTLPSSSTTLWALFKVSNTSTRLAHLQNFLPLDVVYTPSNITAIDTQPDDPSNDSTPSFTFSAEVTGSTFECKIDSGSYSSCTSPYTASTLGDGAHTFYVRATDAYSQTGSVSSYDWTIDTTGPATTIDSSPDSLTNSSSADFTFSAESGATFLCSIDSGSFESCTSPKSYTDLEDGSHTFDVKASDALGNTGSTESYSWTADTTAPVTTLSSTPDSSTSSTTASFTFSSNESGSTFQCKLDSASWATCSSPRSYTGLADGSHTFQVKATDQATNEETSAEDYTWSVDTDGPDATIDTSPVTLTKSRSASFAFSSESGTTFQCSIDSGSFESCTSPKSYSNLEDGDHTFDVMASDILGNTGSTESYDWTVDTTAPVTTLSSKPDSSTSSTTASFSFSSNESGTTFQCKLDSLFWVSCTSPKTYFGLSRGSHTFKVRSIDQAGNRSTATIFTWHTFTAALDADIDLKPQKQTDQDFAVFIFKSKNRNKHTYRCKVDNLNWRRCGSPVIVYGLKQGHHTFKVRTRSRKGSFGKPETWSWNVAKKKGKRRDVSKTYRIKDKKRLRSIHIFGAAGRGLPYDAKFSVKITRRGNKPKQRSCEFRILKKYKTKDGNYLKKCDRGFKFLGVYRRWQVYFTNIPKKYRNKRSNYLLSVQIVEEGTGTPSKRRIRLLF